MSEKLSAAIEELEAQLEFQLREVVETKRVINNLRKRMGQDPLYEDESVESNGSIRPDAFYGKPFATAAQEFLERRKGARSAADILLGLEEGGFDFRATGWKKADDRLRMVAISLAKNVQKFHKLPNSTFGLLSWYPNIVTGKDETDEGE